MSDPYISEIKMVGFNYAPKYWAMCNGTTLGIAQNQALFALLGTYYGGNGMNNFQLPDLRGRFPLHQVSGSGGVGQVGGTTTVTLVPAQLPQHVHQFSPAAAADQGTQQANGWLGGFANGYAPAPTMPAKTLPISPGTVSSVGNSQPHTNMQPYLCVNFAIALSGIWPSRN